MSEATKLAYPRAESPLFRAEMARAELGPNDRALLEGFHDSGFVVIENAIPPDVIERATTDMQTRYAPGIVHGPRSGYRYQDAWRESPAIRDVALDQTVLDTLRLLYGREPMPFQTLNFRVGSQQANHSDALLFNSLPGRFMCGVWVALEDVDEENGPLFYHPGSHKLPEFEIRDFDGAIDDPNHFFGYRYPKFLTALMAEHGCEKKTLHIPKGSFLVWASNLVHGGMPILDESRTRASQVTHYFFEDCAYYSPIYSDQRAGELCLIDVRDFRTGEPVPHTLDGAPTRVLPLRNGRHRLQLESEAAPGALAEASATATANGALGRAWQRFRAQPQPAATLESYVDLVEESDDAIAITGWAYDPKSLGLTGGRLELTLASENERHTYECYLAQRRDVAQIQKLVDSYCGFHVSLHRRELRAGSYQILLRWHAPNGAPLSVDTGRTIEI